MAYHLVNWGMTLALALYLAGFYFRRRDLAKHRVLMSAGVIVTLASAVALIFAVHVMHGGDREAAGFLAAADEWVILTHRAVASVTFLAMFVMVWSGATRRRKIHVNTARFFLPAFIFVYISGLFIFTN
ncbi:MAG: hypothetical protein NXI24_19425 [bacterium]|nr:hypothetical protein [bacterium]